MSDNFYGFLNDDFEEKSFELEGRTVEYRTAVMSKIEQDFLSLNQTDKDFIAYCLVDAEILLKQLDESKDLSNYLPSDLDTLVNLWLDKPNFFKGITLEEFTRALGAAFGNCMNRTFGAAWTVISDEYGTDYACVSDSPKFQTFPFSSSWKAIEQQKRDSFQGIIDLISHHIQNGDFSE